MKLTLNLAGGTYLDRRALYLSYLVLTGILVLLLVLGGILYLRNYRHMQQIRGHLAELERETAVPTPAGGSQFSSAAYGKMLQDIRFANEILAQDSFRWTGLLNRLEEVVPNRVAISGIQPDYKDKSVKLTGRAGEIQSLQQFLDNLIASDDFGDVYLLQQARIREGGSGDAAGALSFSVVVRGAF